jgi:hypothetical protein
VVRVPGYRTEMYCSSCEVWTGQSFWLQIQRSGFHSRRYQIFWEIVGLERGPLNLVSTIEELLGRKISGSGLNSREYGRRDPSRLSRGTLYPQKLALTSPIIGGRSVGIVRSRTQATEFFSSRKIIYSIPNSNNDRRNSICNAKISSLISIGCLFFSVTNQR